MWSPALLEAGWADGNKIDERRKRNWRDQEC